MKVRTLVWLADSAGRKAGEVTVEPYLNACDYIKMGWARQATPAEEVKGRIVTIRDEIRTRVNAWKSQASSR